MLCWAWKKFYILRSWSGYFHGNTIFSCEEIVILFCGFIQISALVIFGKVDNSLIISSFNSLKILILKKISGQQNEKFTSMHRVNNSSFNGI